MLIATLAHFKFENYTLPGQRLISTPEIRVPDEITRTTESRSRWWIAGPNRSFDFALDSYIGIDQPDFKSVKGLLWESHRDHLLLNSYLGTLLSPPVVLDHYFYYGYSCPVQRCVEKQFARTFGVQGVLLGLDRLDSVEIQRKKNCFYEGGAPGVLKSAALFDGVSFYKKYYPESPENELIQGVGSQSLIFQSDQDSWSFAQPLVLAYQDCEKNSMVPRVFVHGREQDSLLNALHGLQYPSPEVRWKKTGVGSYQVDLARNASGLVWVKLSAFPGLRVRSLKSGQPIPYYEANPGFVVFADSSFLIEYQKSDWFFFGGALSVLTLFWITFTLILRQRSG